MRTTSSFFLLALLVAGCGGIKDAVDNANTYMPQIGNLKQNTQQTNQYLDFMSQGVRDQTLAQTLALMLAPSARATYPFPMGFMPGAEKFTQVATPEELSKLLELWLSQVQGMKYDEVKSDLRKYTALNKKIKALQGHDDEASKKKLETLLQQQKDQHLTKEELSTRWKAYNLDKNITLLTMQTIAGMAPPAKARQVYEEQVENDRGAFRTGATTFLVYRALFIQTYLLDAKYSREDEVSNADTLAHAIDLAQELEYLVSLPEMASLKVTVNGLFPSDPDQPDVTENQVVKLSDLLSPANMASTWEKVKAVGDAVTANTKLHPTQRAKLPALNATINQHFHFWTARAVN